MLVLHAESLKLPGIAHGFFGRMGGISTGIYETLNCGPGSGDDLVNVAENRNRVREALGATTLLTLHQIHSPNVVTIADTWEMGKGPQADAMVTNKSNIAVGILTADCAPVLFADSEARVIGAAHAGWKGAISGVTDATLDAMEKLGAKRDNIAASIGPCISRTNYEVGPEFRERFVSEDSFNARFFATADAPNHFRFDLEAYVASRLAVAGVRNAALLSACTYAREADFFSFRRATHRKEPAYGRQISAIMLTG